MSFTFLCRRVLPSVAALLLAAAALPATAQAQGATEGRSFEAWFLAPLQRDEVPVSIYLVNGIKLQGIIVGFSSEAILLRNTATQLVLRHAISTIVPGRVL